MIFRGVSIPGKNSPGRYRSIQKIRDEYEGTTLYVLLYYGIQIIHFFTLDRDAECTRILFHVQSIIFQIAGFIRIKIESNVKDRNLRKCSET